MLSNRGLNLFSLSGRSVACLQSTDNYVERRSDIKKYLGKGEASKLRPEKLKKGKLETMFSRCD